MLKCIVIDDEPLAIKQMQYYISQVEGVELVSTFRSAVEAREWLAQSSIDLIFCDINMPQISGVEFVSGMQQGVDDLSSLPMVIFTTAYAEYAVEGFRLDAVDYLLKPFSVVDFSRSVQRAKSLYELRYGRSQQGEQEEESVVESLQSDSQSEYISVKADYKVMMIRIADIIYIESEGEYIRIHIEGRRPITTLYRLKNMEADLPSSQFVRVHRSYIVNTDKVYSFDRSRVYFSKEDYIPIGLNYRAQLQQRLSAKLCDR